MNKNIIRINNNDDGDETRSKHCDVRGVAEAAGGVQSSLGALHSSRLCGECTRKNGRRHNEDGGWGGEEGGGALVE